LETKGHPDLVDLYKVLGAPKNYEAHFNIHFKHNYNHVSRTQMYDFANRHLGLGLKTPVLESDFEFLGKDETSVWKNPEDKPKHWKSGPEHERELNAVWAKDSDDRVAAAMAKAEKGDKSDLEDVVGKGWRIILRRSYEDVGDVEFALANKKKTEKYVVMTGLISNKSQKEEVPALFYHPTDWNGEVAIWLSNKGKAALYKGGADNPIESVQKLIDAGTAVIGLDLFMQGEFLNGEETKVQNRNTTYSRKNDVAADSWQRSPVYYYGYNDSTFVRRVHDVLSAVKLVKTHPKWEVKKVSLFGFDGSTHWAAAAAAMGGNEIDQIITDSESQFRFADLDDMWHEDFVPGAVRYGDVEGFISMLSAKKNTGSLIER